MIVFFGSNINIRFTRLITIVLIVLFLNGCGGGGSSSSGVGGSTIVVGGGSTIDVGNSLSVNAISDGNISWDFSSPVQSGKFANGDHWVVGPVTITSITPSYNGNNHGFEVNPVSTNLQGFDTRIGSFTPSLVPSLPYDAVPGESIIKVVSVTPSNTGCRPCIQSASILTILSAPPVNNGATIFRPPYFGTNKPLYSVEDLNFSLLPNYAPTANATSFVQVANQYSQPQLDHKVGWSARFMHPADSMPDYGADIAGRNTEASLALMLQGNVQGKAQAVINYVNYGIDIYHQMKAGVTWPANGGHGEGRKLPAIMAAVLLENNTMINDLTNVDPATFGETSGVYFSAMAENGNGKVLWGQRTAQTTAASERSYWEMLVLDNGARNYKDPYQQIDGGRLNLSSSYQYCCTSMVWVNIVTALELMPSLRAVFNFPNLKSYTDRWMTAGFYTQPDSCAPPSNAANFNADYGVVFGPDGSGGCIQDLDLSDGIGRYPQSNGTGAGTGSYGSTFAAEMRAAYIP